MKNKIISLFVLLCLVSGITDVRAYEKDSTFTRYKSDNVQLPGLKYGSSSRGWKNHSNSIFYAANDASASEKYFIYCTDPALSAWKKLKVDHILLGADSTTKAEDYGILTILKNGKWQYNGDPTSDAEKADYETTSMAVRMFINGIAGWNYRHVEDSMFPAFIGNTYQWVNSDSQMKEAYKTLTGKEPIHILNLYGYNVSSIQSFSYTDASLSERVKNYLKQGLLAAASYKKGEVAMPEIEVLTAGGTDVEETTYGSSTTYERLLVASISLKNFTLTGSTPGYFNYKGIEITTSNTNVQELGYSFEYSEDESAYAANGLLSQSVNLAQLLEEQDKDKVYIAYKVTYTTADTEACNTKFELKYEYNDEKLLNGAMLFPYDDAGKDYTNAQRFVFYSNGAIQDAHTMNAKMCNSYCSPTIGLPQICDDDVDPSDIDRDGNVAYEFREGYKNGSYEIDKCILNNTDSASNPYKLVDNKNASIVSNNPYCTISCKEDYIFNVPYKITVDNGRYFRISMSIKGQQDCYSSKLNTDKFNQDIIQAQIDIVNNYNKWQQAVELLDTYERIQGGSTTALRNTGRSIKCHKRTCETSGSGEDRTCNSGLEESASTPEKEFEFIKTYYQINVNTGAVSTTNTPVIYNGEVSSGTAAGEVQNKKIPFGKVENTVGSCNASCSVRGYSCDITSAEEDFENYINDNDIEGQLEDSKQKLNEAIERLKQVVDQYNGCMADHDYDAYSSIYNRVYWDMIYKYDPEISYWYDEPDPQDYDQDKWIEEVQSLSCGDNTCDVMKPKKEVVYSEKCDEDDEKCRTVTSVKTIFDNETVPTTEYCKDGYLNESTYECSNPQSDVTYQNKSYFVCSPSGDSFSCSYRTYLVTDLSYIHKVATSEGKYDTHRVYYSKVPNGGIEISNTKVRNATMVDGLPIGASTPPGTYFYVLSLNNLGQYYSNQRLGRIFGTNTTSISTVERLEREETINNDELRGNEYACTYAVTQTCTDDYGIEHDVEECHAGESWNKCKKRLCPNGRAANYCVKEAESYYVCDNEYYDEATCTKHPTRDSAIAASEENYNCCPQCKVLCIGNCVYDLTRYPEPGNLNLDFRPITPSVVNPNDRQLGYNWDINNPTNVLVAQKAGNTISEIEARANIDVETTSREELEAIEEYSLKVTMTPAMANWIREYNNDQEDNGSYNNDTLTCYDYSLPDQSHYPDQETCMAKGYNWDSDESKCVMANAFCYSNFITELNDHYDVEVDSPKRDQAIASAHNNYQIYTRLSALPHQGTGLGDNSYQIQTVNDYWTVYTYINLDINGDKIADIGPAWK